MELQSANFFNRRLQVFKDRPQTISKMLYLSVQKYSDKKAIISNGQCITYLELWRQSRQVATYLVKKLGVKKGERISILLGNGIEFSLLFFACAHIGAILVPLNTRLKEKEIHYMISQSRSKVIVTDEEFLPKAEKLREVLADHSQMYTILVSSEPHKDYIPFNDLLMGDNEDDQSVVFESDPITLIYTSGTTGVPKGAIGSHLGFIHAAMNYRIRMKTDEKTRTLIAVPLFHVTGLIGQLLHVLSVGGTCVLMRRFKTESFLELLKKEKITFLFNVPTIYVKLLSEKKFSNDRYESVRTVAYGGAAMPYEVISKLQRHFPEANFHNTYGATETSSPTSIMPLYYPHSKQKSVGLPILGADIKLIDQDGRECGVEEIGELYIKGSHVVEGYWNNVLGNRDSFKDGYWCSGDIARIDQDGFLYILDRKKDMINRGGENIYSLEIENLLYDHPNVKEVAVVGIPDVTFGEIVKAVIVPKHSPLTEQEIKRFVNERLADYKVPAQVEFVKELPRNPGGKLLKAQLK
ncbi:class I adenylate-forming enzyme family protein [Guptibacillus hwajinpoensis]|uniref:class I adenylate-forming enzyme family protein n=1 Tax=Guptibacillus hwajinpoensis TaxID=208199 RepID=UPI001CFD1CF8|nr:class I adenylate-forming enzyme family protein [Pseudalkalibacillus hwajinpoensis]WLR61007.1 class I adenylate-forming enzyme family protein [Pseudalkalibacillus hwajinpoensis]